MLFQPNIPPRWVTAIAQPNLPYPRQTPSSPQTHRIKASVPLPINSISEHAGRGDEVLFGTEHRFRVTNFYEENGQFHVDLEEL